MKQNKLTRIEVGTFDSLTELKELWLQKNQLSVIEKGLFDKNTKLKNLFMNENKIVAIESTVFQNLNQQINIHLIGNLCSNENFQSNNFNRTFACFKNYKLLKPYLKQIDQSELEKKISNNDKSACVTEKDRLNADLTTKLNDLTHCETRLSNCEDQKSINEEEFNLAAKLKTKKSELSQTLREKSTCLAEKDSKNKAFKEMLNELSNMNNILNDCQRENKTIYQERDQLIEKLQTCESTPMSNNDESTQNDKNETDIFLNFWIVAGILGLIILVLLIAFLISIMKIHKLLDDNKDLNAKLDKLCVDHVYEKVD